MRKNEDGMYTYLDVPSKYNCVYKKLLIKLSDLGVDMIKDCTSTCKGINRQVINCWNMFQSACAAYALGYWKQTDLLVNYINTSLQFGCTEYTTDEKPVFMIFELNIPITITGSQKIKYNEANFVIANREYVVEDTLTIYRVINGRENIIASGLSVNSPVKFNELVLNAEVGQVYIFRASVEGEDGETYYSNDYIVECVSVPAMNVMYYGHTDIAPQVFDKMSIDDIMSIEGNTPRTITGNTNNTFIIKQKKKIHYLLIPDELMTLVKAEYGTILVTTLWDGEEGAYKTNNIGGIYEGIHYNVFFLYSPSIFDDDIRITCRNK
jgi:hypothetical protein